MSERNPDGPHEHSSRRPDFCGGQPITLVDGNTWYFAEPRLRLVPCDSAIGFETMLSVDDGGEFDRLITEYAALVFLPPDEFRVFAERFMSLEMKLSRMMLERNYNLTTDQLRCILQISHSENDKIAHSIRSQLHQIIAGDGPKTLAGGDEASHTPPAESNGETEC